MKPTARLLTAGIISQLPSRQKTISRKANGVIRAMRCVMDTEDDKKGEEMQADLFGAPDVPAYQPNIEKVRSRLHKILAEVRGATAPWEPATLSLYQTIFPQMADFLPDAEGAQLRFEFEVEVERLKAA